MKFKGLLEFFSETGTEGGYWAFQDEQYIHKNDYRYSCKKCGHGWDKKADPEGKTLIVSIPVSLIIKNNMQIPEPCRQGKHDFKLWPENFYDYEGLHCLQNGDILTIYSKKGRRILWKGVIKLKAYKLFTQRAGCFWIHEDQIGISRKKWAKWFFEGYPAELETKRV